MLTSSNNTITPTRKPSLRFIFTNEFGYTTDIAKDLNAGGIGDLFWAIRYALAGCGFGKETIEKWFPEE